MDHLVSSAVSSVFGTMLNLPVREKSHDVPANESEALIAGSVGFIGVTTGVVFVYSTVAFARKAASGMLGSTASDEMVNDAFGEITNMIVGHIKSRLVDRGMSCALTIPSIVRGNNFTIEPTSSSLRRISTFQCGDNQVVVEVLLKSNSAQTALAA
ncbi:MAG: chemotaxis protein CheX [Limisphaerales bacterium]